MLTRRIATPNLWDREFDRLRREMNRLFENASTGRPRTAPGFPAMNVWTNEEGAVITAELPGIHPEDIDVSITGETLTLTGSREAPNFGENARIHRQERGTGKFKRSIELPFRVDAEQVQASFEQGVLHIEDYADPSGITGIGTPLEAGDRASDELVRVRGLQVQQTLDDQRPHGKDHPGNQHRAR